MKKKEESLLRLPNDRQITWISHYFRRMQQRIGLEDVYHFHSTRHYCVSTLHANGLPDAYIMERGGWATTDVLNYVYRHTFSSQSAALTDRALNHFESVTKLVVIIEKINSKCRNCFPNML